MNKKTHIRNDFSLNRLLEVEDRSSFRIHFIGIGGVSMYSLARLSLKLGFAVSGSDREESHRTRELSLLGARIGIGHLPQNVDGASLTVFSHAISEANPELSAAREQGIQTVSRAAYLGSLMQKYRVRIGVCGSHGKSSTTAMTDTIFTHAGYDPTTLSGADLTIGEPLRIGGRGTLIYEACEYKDSFLEFSPTVAVGLNLELDHTDYFPDLSAIKTSFSSALGRATSFALINGDDPNLKAILPTFPCRTITFGCGESNDYQYMITSFTDAGIEFDVLRYGSSIGKFRLNVPGVYNVKNATAAIVVALEQGIDASTIAEAVTSYRGIPRRLELIGHRFGRPIYYDYAHHPTEISEAINALRELTHRPITVIFKPHTYSRTKALWDDFVSSLSLADRVILCDIFPAREQPIDGITSERLAGTIGRKAVYCSEDDVTNYLDLHTEGTIVLMGAGDMEKIKKKINRKDL